MFAAAAYWKLIVTDIGYSHPISATQYDLYKINPSCALNIPLNDNNIIT